MTSILTSSVLGALRIAADEQQKQLLALLRQMVEIESPSEDRAACSRCVAFVAEECGKAGARVRVHRRKSSGGMLEARFGPVRRGQKPLLLLGHLDTVWPMGTLGVMPFRITEERVAGPGVLDMKAGVAMAIVALQILTEKQMLDRQVILLLSCDEETGSRDSRAMIERIASACSAVFVLEPAQGLSGAYKTARKGVGSYTVRVEGIAAHSGVDFEKGHSAVLELARQIPILSEFTELDRGITVNAGTVSGGTRSNVIAAEAEAEVDVRIARKADAARIDRRFRSLRAVDKACKLTVSGGINRPPMERTRATAALFRHATTLAAGLGFTLEEASTGGGSDGNFTSALGVPTLDGMGAVGEAAHARHESLLLAHLAPRTALLAAMIASLPLKN
ncbi:M20 family metallopeptidase [Acidipila rosea]|uniref:Glutamate carboxypeptidase n=1 Tax=Acidipila rosea TaxID=768535 RepID=A0A4R1L1Q6_9BACT|nr:M20 family metallopeptidase [Acidipila rosea]TCK70870.1 glutamate carboxypeptidase [Acidipila rosea]